MELNICSSCSKCPKVITKEGSVEIGEEGKLVRFKSNEWNNLVGGIKTGKLDKI